MALHTVESTRAVRSGFLGPGAPPMATTASGDVVSHPNTWTRWGSEGVCGRTFADTSMAALVGEWYLHSRSAHRNATVIEAYGRLQAEIDHLYRLLTTDAGPRTARVVFTRDAQPYASDKELIAAVRADGTMEITSAAAAGERLHPLLGCELGGPFDRFRAVHDLIGHVRLGYGFDLAEECAAWSAQDQFHSGLARCALATELYAVNAARSICGDAPELRALLLAPSTLRSSSQRRGTAPIST